MLLAGGDHEDSSVGEMRVEGGDVDVGGELVRTVDLSADGSELVSARLVRAVDEELLSDDLHLNLLGSEEGGIESDLKLVSGVVHLDDSIGVLERPVPLVSGPVVVDGERHC